MSSPDLPPDLKTELEAHEAEQKAKKDRENAETLARLKALSPEERQQLLRSMRGDPDQAQLMGSLVDSLPEPEDDPALQTLIAAIKEAAHTSTKIEGIMRSEQRTKGGASPRPLSDESEDNR